jgi:alkanesulfonate monooxygenase SsuD/methylene tetrahydromethanopterin reductase-like flavin-dependent oxidoreductase (luciferase family)
MRFGLFFQAPERAGETHAQRFTEMLELATLADSLGFDVAWLAEIHFGGSPVVQWSATGRNQP